MGNARFLLAAAIISIAAGGLRAADGKAGKRYAVVVGVNEYADGSILKLKTPRNDAADLSARLAQLGWDKVFLMTDALDYRNQNFPSKSNIESRVLLLADLAKPEDAILLFFSGHGIGGASGDQYFLPVDAAPLRPEQTGVRLSSLVEGLKKRNIDNVALIVDACRESLSQTKGLSVVGIGGAPGKAGFPAAGQPALAMYATSAGWYSYEDKDGRNGVFTKYLLDGLAGQADGADGSKKDGDISYRELARWLPDAVTSYALDAGLRQKPVAVFGKADFGPLSIGNINKLSPSVPDENSIANWEILDGAWYEKDGAFYGSGGMMIYREALEDYVLELTAEKVTEASWPAVGIGTRFRVVPGGAKNYRNRSSEVPGYWFNFTFDRTFNLFYGAAAAATYLIYPEWTQWPRSALLDERSNRIRIEAIKDSVRIAVNGRELAMFTDGHYPRGSPLLAVQEPDQVVRFSNIRITRK